MAQTGTQMLEFEILQPTQQQQQQQQPGQRPSPGLRGGGGSSETPRSQSQPNDRAAESPSQGGGSIGPITGDFRSWSDAMRDVEEMVDRPDLRAQAVTIRDRVRQTRAEMKRHGEEPKWQLVEDMIAKPLQELKREVRAELLRRTAGKNELVPIDRDPVPSQYSRAVQRYYENLGSAKQAPSAPGSNP